MMADANNASRPQSLQKQGVPIPSKLRGPGVSSQAGSSVQPRAKTSSPSRNAARSGRNTRRARDYNPATVGGNVAGSTGGGVGTLEAEFLVALALLILLMFSSGAAYTDKIMSVMKRGTLLCALFFILALVASAGPNAAKGAKAFGALVIVAVLVTSPMGTVITDLDNLVKNDWAGSNESGGTGSNNLQAASADSGTQSSTSNIAQDFISSVENQLNLQGSKTASNAGQVVKTGVENGTTSTLNAIIPGLGSAIGKLFGI